MSEAQIQQQIRLALGRRAVLFRNNCGSYQDNQGRWIRYGVCNPGGSDLIGWTSTTITQTMVGAKVAIFTAVEVKTAKGRATKHQENFIDQVRAAGGIAGIVRSTDEAQLLLDSMI